MSDRIELKFAWDAYCRSDFDTIYDRHADELGHRPAFTVLHGGDHARVVTNTQDAEVARAIIAEAESH